MIKNRTCQIFSDVLFYKNKVILKKRGENDDLFFPAPRVCSQEMRVDLDEQGRIENLEVLGGCSGNLKGISALVRGMSAREAVERLKGIRCGAKSTSCPDQLAQGLEQILAQQEQ